MQKTQKIQKKIFSYNNFLLDNISDNDLDPVSYKTVQKKNAFKDLHIKKERFKRVFQSE